MRDVTIELEVTGHGTHLVTLDAELRERAAPVVPTFTPGEWLDLRP